MLRIARGGKPLIHNCKCTSRHPSSAPTVNYNVRDHTIPFLSLTLLHELPRVRAKALLCDLHPICSPPHLIILTSSPSTLSLSTSCTEHSQPLSTSSYISLQSHHPLDQSLPPQTTQTSKMNSILALQKLVRRSLATTPKATQPQAGPSSAKSARVDQASADKSSATSTTAARRPTSPATSRPVIASSAGRAVAQDERGRSSDTSSADDERPKLQPKRQKDRRSLPSAPYTRPDNAARVTFEEFNGPNEPMPVGYPGTLGSLRFGHTAVEDYMPCGTGGSHFLTCGHAIVAIGNDKTCGTNCKNEVHEVQPFNCPQCHDVVKEILNNSLTVEEKAKIGLFRTGEDGLSLALAVEYVTKRTPIAQRNITETVAGIISPQYGRACRTVPAGAKKPSNLAEMFREEHSTMEEKTRARWAEAKSGSLNTPEKRKNIEDLVETPETQEAGPLHTGERIKKQVRLSFY
jgi:hypothetical protein